MIHDRTLLLSMATLSKLDLFSPAAIEYHTFECAYLGLSES